MHIAEIEVRALIRLYTETVNCQPQTRFQVPFTF